jgi:ankyrin repeat protein
MKRLGLFIVIGTLALAPAPIGAAAAPPDVRLIEAARQQDAATALRLVREGVDVTVADGDGSTALHWAAYHGDLALTKALLQAGARVTPVTRVGGMGALFMAARNGHAAVVRALLDAGADARGVNANGTTVLMMAAGSGSAEAVRMLIAAGAEVNATDATNGQTALMFAAARNGVGAIEELLAHGADARATTRVFKLERVQVDAMGNPIPPPGEEPADTPAANRSSAETPPAKTAAETGRKRPAGERRGGGDRILGATVIGGMSALHFAAREGHAGAVRTLVEGGADVNLVTGGDQTSPITEAIINGHLDIAKYLLEEGANPTLANLDGLTPLYAAIDMKWRANTWYPQPTVDEERTNYLDLMTALIDAGADVHARLKRKLWFRKFRYGDDWVDPNGATAFWRAAQANDVSAMRLLAARGADPTIATVNGVTPLMVAAGIGFEYQGTNIAPDSRRAAVKYLVDELHADVNAKDAKHYTTLHGAAYVGDNDLITYLVSKGADPRARAKGRLGGTQGAEDVPEGTGDTVADMANGPREKSLLHPETVKLLEALGSQNSHDCRSTACVNNTRAEKPAAKPQQ